MCIGLSHQGTVGSAGKPDQRDPKPSGVGQQVGQLRCFAGIRDGKDDEHLEFERTMDGVREDLGSEPWKRHES